MRVNGRGPQGFIDLPATDNSLDTVGNLIRRDDVVLGLGDGGAHYGMICDSSYPTYLLAHWARDRDTYRLSVAEAVRELTSTPAKVAGLLDRGRIEIGYKADLNIIDHASLRLHKPVVTHDLLSDAVDPQQIQTAARRC